VGIGEFFFGSSGGVKTEQVPRWNPEQQKLFSQMYGLTSPQIGKGMEPTPEESQYGDFLKNYEPWYRGVVGEAYNPQAVKDYYRDAVNPEFEQNYIPKIRSEFAGPGYWGEARARAIGDAWSGLGRQEAADVYGVEKAKSAAIADLTNRLPVAKQTLASWSRLFTPEGSPYLQLAITLLGLQPFDTIGGMMQPTPGLFGSLAGGFGEAAGEAAGTAMFA